MRACDASLRGRNQTDLKAWPLKHALRCFAKLEGFRLVRFLLELVAGH